MLEVIRDALRPYADPVDRGEQRRRETLAFFSAKPSGTVRELAERLGCSVRSAERLVARLSSCPQVSLLAI